MIILISADNGVNVGITHGHVYDTEGVPMQEASVSVQVYGCSLPACIGQDSSTESSGYYYIGNLALPENHRVDAYASLGTMFGSAFGNSNDNYLAEIDIIICDPPTTPTLTPEPNTHDQFATVKWNSGVQPSVYGYSIFDQLELNGNLIQNQINTNDNANQDYDLTSLTFQTHNWRVRTCNNYCCSPWVADSFNVGNTAPSAPVLTHQPDTTPTTLDFNWISGIDQDGDETYDEYQYHIIEETWESTVDATSPITNEVFGCNYYEWRVRTCERESQNLCSSWATDGFIACGLTCPSCSSNCAGGSSSGGSSGSGTCTTKIQSLVITNPQTIEEDSLNPLKINFATTGLSENVWFKINSSEFEFNDYSLSQIKNSKANFELIGKPKEGLEAGEYNLTVEVLQEGKPSIIEILPITVTKSLVVRIKRVTQRMSKWKITFLIFLSILIIWTILYYYIKHRNLKKSKLPNSKKSKIVKKIN